MHIKMKNNILDATAYVCMHVVVICTYSYTKSNIHGNSLIFSLSHLSRLINSTDIVNFVAFKVGEPFSM